MMTLQKLVTGAAFAAALVASPAFAQNAFNSVEQNAAAAGACETKLTAAQEDKVALAAAKGVDYTVGMFLTNMYDQRAAASVKAYSLGCKDEGVKKMVDGFKAL